MSESIGWRQRSPPIGIKRQLDSSLYERLALSRDKREVCRLAREGQVVEKATDVIKDPVVLEFLGLEEPENSQKRKPESRRPDGARPQPIRTRSMNSSPVPHSISASVTLAMPSGPDSSSSCSPSRPAVSSPNLCAICRRRTNV